MGFAMLDKSNMSVLLQILQFAFFLFELGFFSQVGISSLLPILHSQPEVWLPHPGLLK